MNLTPSALTGQFVLCRDRGHIPEGWPVRTLHGWHLGSHPWLPVADVRSEDSTPIGWLLGHSISPQGTMVHESVRFRVAPWADNAADKFESDLYEYGGRFAAVCVLPNAARFYLDPCGSLASVFSTRQKLIASTPKLVPTLDEDKDRELIRLVRSPAGDCFYPFELTPWRSICRLMPNHYLDLVEWHPRRHWPAGEILPAPDTSDAIARITDTIQRNVAAVAGELPLCMSLTAGRDSRMLLACARTYINHTVFFTYRVPTPRGRIDCKVAEQLARRFGLKHVFLPLVPGDDEHTVDWRERTGDCVNDAFGERAVALRHLEPDRAILLGIAGELGRGFHWRRDDTPRSAIAPEDLLTKLKMPFSDVTRTAASHWLQRVPCENALTIWGLLYNEVYNGCVLGPAMYGFIGSAAYLWPLCHRQVVEKMLSLPPEYRRSNRMPEDLIRREWPEVLALPFNWPLGMAGYAYSVKWRLQALLKRLRRPTRTRGDAPK